jgi:cholesterol transport system auxiliary component
MTPGRRRLLALGAGAPLLLGGCARLLLGGKAAPPSEYRLTPAVELPAKLPMVDWVLTVAEPTAEGAIESVRIAVLAHGRIDRLADVVWTDRPTKMLQFAIVQTLQGSGRLKAVGTDRDDLPGRYQLQSTLDAFQLEPEGDGYAAVVMLHARLLRLPGREVAGSQMFTRGVRAAGASNDAAVAAFDAAVSGVLEDLVPWTLRAGRT